MIDPLFPIHDEMAQAWAARVHALMATGLGYEDIALQLRREGQSPCGADDVRAEARRMDPRSLAALYRTGLGAETARAVPTLDPQQQRAAERSRAELAWTAEVRARLTRTGLRVLRPDCPHCGAMARAEISLAGRLVASCPTPSCLRIAP